MAALRELLISFGVEFDTAKLDEGTKAVESSLDRMIGGGKKLLGAFQELAIVAIVGKWTEAVVDGSVELLHASERIGLGAQQLKFWRYAGSLVGVEAGEMDIALRRLSVAIGGLGPEGKDLTAIFTKLGISTKDAHGNVRTLDDVLPDIVANFSKLKEGPEQTAAAVKLFGRNGAALVPFLKQGKEGLASMNVEFIKLAGVVNNESLEAAENYEQSQIKLGVVWKSLRSAAVSWLIPMLSKLSDWAIDLSVAFRDWNKETGFLSTAIKTGLVYALLTLVPILWSLLAPLLLSTAQFALLALAVDDFIGAWEGKDSLIGSIIDKAFGPGTTQKIVKWIKGAVDKIKFWFDHIDLSGALLEIGTLVQKIVALWEDPNLTPQQKFQALLDFIGGNFRKIMKALLGDVGGDIVTEFVGAVTEVISAFNELYGIAKTIFGWIVDAIGAVSFGTSDAIANLKARDEAAVREDEETSRKNFPALVPADVQNAFGPQSPASPAAQTGGGNFFGPAPAPIFAPAPPVVAPEVNMYVNVAPGTTPQQAQALAAAGAKGAAAGLKAPNRAAAASVGRTGFKS